MEEDNLKYDLLDKLDLHENIEV